eukprot:scaffold27486_cov67-Skeletonema_dohrnii-CCMP3373.AAC.1
MDPPADHHDGEQERRQPLISSPRRGTAVGSRYMTLLLVLSFICFVSTFLTYNRILSPYLEVMTLSIDQPMPPDDLPPVVNDDLSDKPAAVDDKQKKQLLKKQQYPNKFPTA